MKIFGVTLRNISFLFPNTYLAMTHTFAFWRTLIALSGFFFFLLSCEENPPFTINTDDTPIDTSQNYNDTIPFIDKDTVFMAEVVTPQSHVVLIEEFTGVNCVNCPAGHDITKDILANNPNRAIAAIIHAGFLTDAHPNSTQIFVTPETEAMYDLLLVEAVPAAAIDRTLFDGEERLAITSKSQWAGRVASKLSDPTPVNVYLHRQYDPATRQLNIFAQLRYTENVADAHNITIYVTENDITDSQLLPDPISGQNTVNDAYIHQHVVRDVVTATSGDAIQATPPQNSGLVVVKKFTTTLSTAWNVDKCHIVALVHQASGDKKVLQATELAVME